MSTTEDLLTAIKAGEAGRVREMLRADRSLADGRGPGGETPLLIAVYYGAKEIISLLLEYGARPDPFEAAALGDTGRLREILQDRPDMVYTYSHDGWTPLHLAAHFGQVAAIDWLLRHGAPTEARSTNGLANMPLHAAAAGRRRRALELLLVAGAYPQATDSEGHTALHIAAQNGEVEMVRLLLGFGAQPEAEAQDGQTPLSLADRAGHLSVIEMLRAHTPAH